MAGNLKDQSVDAAVRHVQAQLNLGAVAVVGAGLSLHVRYPSTAGLLPLLWHALDADVAERARLAERLGRPDAPGKTLLANDAAATAVAWHVIESSEPARQAFQHAFAAMDAERANSPSPSHDALVRLLHARVVEIVVSFNWDTALETAYRRRYGTRVPSEWLLKPHGDAANPDTPWILPHQSGRVSDVALLTLSTMRAEHPRVLLIVGYSESDEQVVQQLIAPLDERWPVVRVGPSASGPFAIAATAETVLPRVGERVFGAEDRSPWEHVTFHAQRDLGAALSGARLGPGDVHACPRLPEVSEVLDALNITSAVVLSGKSGSGKSITAYQALAARAGAGREVVRLRDGARSESAQQLVDTLCTLPRPVDALIDDAQSMTSDALRRLLECAAADRSVLVVSTDDVLGPAPVIRIAEGRAVAVLAESLRRQSGVVLPLVAALDNQVGPRPSDDSLEWRIDTAAKEGTPWQFFFAVTGGWRRAATVLWRLRDEDRIDLVLLAVALGQVASADAGASRAWLSRAASLLGRDETWLDGGLMTLMRQRLITGSDGSLRCAHLRLAWVVVAELLHLPRSSVPHVERVYVPPITCPAPAGESSKVSGYSDTRVPVLEQAEQEADRRSVTALTVSILDDPATSLRGLWWLLGRNHTPEARWVLAKQGVAAESRLQRLADRCLRTAAGPESGIAASLLADLRLWNGTVDDAIKAAKWQLVAWVDYLGPDSCWGIANLFNELGQSQREFTEFLLADTDATRLAVSMCGADWATIPAYARAIDRLCYAGGRSYARRVDAAINADALRDLFGRLPAGLYEVGTVLKSIYFLNPVLGEDLVEIAVPQIAARINADPTTGTEEARELLWWPLGLPPAFLRRGSPSRRQQRMARALARRLEPQRIAAAMERADLRDWDTLVGLLSFLEEADKEVYESVVSAVNFDVLDNSMQDMWEVSPGQLFRVLAVLVGKDGRPATTLLDRHAGQLVRLHAVVALIAPDSAVATLRRGVPLDLGLTTENWELAASAVESIAGVDPDVARRVIEANKDAHVVGLNLRVAGSSFGLGKWVTVCDRVAPGAIDEALDRLEAAAIQSWRKRLRKSSRDRDATAALARRAAGRSSSVADAAQRLLRRFPSLA